MPSNLFISVTSRVKSNPLATRFVSPGKLVWRSRTGESLDEIANRFRALHSRAAIVGPHGTGKSTLLEHLAPLVANDAGQVVWLKLRGRIAACRALLESHLRWARAGKLLIIDGYEQLPWIARAYCLWISRWTGTSILITSHRTTSLPTLFNTSVDEELACELLDELLPLELAQRNSLLDRGRLRQLLVKHSGNLREVFMELYDLLEEDSRTTG